MKIFKAIFSGIGYMIIGAVSFLSVIALSVFVLLRFYNFNGWDFVFYGPFIILGGIVIGIVINATIYVIVEDVAKHRARKVKKAQQKTANITE